MALPTKEDEPQQQQRQQSCREFQTSNYQQTECGKFRRRRIRNLSSSLYPLFPFLVAAVMTARISFPSYSGHSGGGGMGVWAFNIANPLIHQHSYYYAPSANTASWSSSSVNNNVMGENEDDDDSAFLRKLGLNEKMNDNDFKEEEEDNDDKFDIATGNDGSTKLSSTASSIPPLPPLPEFMNEEDDFDDDDFFLEEKKIAPSPLSSSSSASPSTNTETATSKTMAAIQDETRKQMEQQQQQIDMLMKMIQKQGGGEELSSTSSATTKINDNSNFRSMTTDKDLSLTGKPLSSSSSSSTTTVNVAPLRAMLFIDGTWLYYSLHQRSERDCPIIKKYGVGWQNRYRFEWSALPRVVCEQLQLQQMDQGWSTTNQNRNNQPRPIDIVRASVFTSYKRTTDPNSIRVTMYNEMADANYDVHMMETVGKGEKCVDIQLAVEMLHYATVPNAYDVAILLSGDKDFMPAMVRTRQKGRQVGIVSMKRGCNKALYESPHVKDYDVIWIEDYLDKLIVPLSPEELAARSKEGIVSTFTVMKVVSDFVANSPKGKVSSRDVGRYLKTLRVADTTMLEQLKEVYGGLRQFLQERAVGVFRIIDPEIDDTKKRDPRDRSFWMTLREGYQHVLISQAKATNFTAVEKGFLEEYAKSGLEKKHAYYHTNEDPERAAFTTTPIEIQQLDNPSARRDVHNDGVNGDSGEDKFELPSDLTVDYTQCTVVQLKERCRERGLLVSGTKAVLLQRVQKDVDEQINAEKLRHGEKMAAVAAAAALNAREDGPAVMHRKMATPRRSSTTMRRAMMGGSRLGQGLRRPQSSFSPSPPPSGMKVYNSNIYATQTPKFTNNRNINAENVDPVIENHLRNLIAEYITASGGQAGSRDVGRYLAANAAVNAGRSQQGSSALKELKHSYGTLAAFIAKNDDMFDKLRENVDQYGWEYGFPIRLRKVRQ